jgi:glycosyltransferase involved in cell wall biosynthesis
VLDLDPGFGRKDFEARHRDLFVASAEELPFSINCFVLPPPTLDSKAARFASLLSRPGVLNVAFSMWELPQVPEAWHPAMQMFDALAAGSPFIRHSFEFSLPDARVIDAPLFLPLRGAATPQRRQFGLDGDSCYCIASFEPFSEIKRKNIVAVVAAFKAAVAAAPNLKLIIKINNAVIDGTEHPDVALLRNCISGIPGVRLITDTLQHWESLSLFASCDIYVSLHRSEGFGLGMYEAMQLAKPVIATGWSGNMGFMNHVSACLTGYQLVAVGHGGGAYSSRDFRAPVYWADASIDDAAKWLARLAGSPELRQATGSAAHAAIAAYETNASRGEFLDELKAMHLEKQLLNPGSTRLARYLPQVLQQRAKSRRKKNSLLRRLVRKARGVLG